MNAVAVEALVEFQVNGRNFDRLWAGIEATVEATVRRGLRRRYVTGPGGGDDLTAVDDCKQQVAIRLLKLPTAAGRGWFNPARSRDRADGLRGWLHRIASNEVITYCRHYRRTRGGRRLVTLSDLELNEPAGRPGGADPRGARWLKSPLEVDFDAFEIREAIADSVLELSDHERTLYRLWFVEMLPQRAIGQSLGIPAGTVCRQLKAVVRKLAEALAARGIDTDWADHQTG